MKIKILSAALVIMISVMVFLASCGNSYNYTSGNVDWESTYSAGNTIHDTFYYSDDWFSEKPEKQNDELALASMQLTAAAVDDDENGTGATFLRSLGFDEIGFSDFASSDSEDCNYIWARKTIGSGNDESTLVAVVIQSFSSDNTLKRKAWRQNVTVNDPESADPSGEHFAFARAADKAADDIAGLGNSENVKYWITGMSRGGAVTNILAARLAEKLGDRNAGIYAYTFESPATVDEETAGSTDYGYIHNYVCSDDLVTMIPVWGMTRYGVTHDLKTDKTDEDLTGALQTMGSEAADLKPRIIAKDEADKFVSKLSERVPSRADYSAVRTDSFTDPDGVDHEITYSYQDGLALLMDFIFGGDGEDDSPLSALISKRSRLGEAVTHIAEGITMERNGEDPYSEYWAGTMNIYSLLEEASGEKPSVSEEDLYKILVSAAPVFIDVPESSSEEPSMDLLVNMAGYKEEMTYSHQADTLIARLKLLAPAPEK